MLQPQLQGVWSLAKQIGSKDVILDLTVIASMVQTDEAAMVTRSRVPGAPVIVGQPQSVMGRRTRRAHMGAGRVGLDHEEQSARRACQRPRPAAQCVVRLPVVSGCRPVILVE